ncbi:MAG TPA: hypothetical protein VMB21_04140 [Candidatus Limnocylindria bacterium]|jgi:hypothetical protein|nr:hypothetical protein [Candidatus Limnocylindria bacterium]
MSEPSEDFSEIRRVLAWKRHETPPPGYFNNFSAKIIARIEADESAGRLPWWQHLLAPLNWQRGLLGANILICAGAGIVGVAAYNAVSPATEDENVALTGAPASMLPPDSRAAVHAGFLPDGRNGDGALSLAGFGGSIPATTFQGTNDHTPPASLFSLPAMNDLQPRFVLPSH